MVAKTFDGDNTSPVEFVQVGETSRRLTDPLSYLNYPSMVLGCERLDSNLFEGSEEKPKYRH